MIRLFTIVFLVVCIHFNQYSVESTVFLCNATASCGCSRFAADMNVRMVGDEIAINHSGGWIVSLRNHLGNSICGGSILSQSYVLTAAHCVYHKVLTPDSLTIIVGANTLNSNDGQNISLKKIFIHPAYDQFSKENDIAILYLRKPIDSNDVNIAKMCLPAVLKAEQSQYPIVNKPVVAIGWGTTSSSGPLSNFLRQVTLKIESYDRRCRSSLGNTNIQFCATVNGGGKGK
jgi:secreted trypsin-like serine protease